MNNYTLRYKHMSLLTIKLYSWTIPLIKKVFHKISNLHYEATKEGLKPHYFCYKNHHITWNKITNE